MVNRRVAGKGFCAAILVTLLPLVNCTGPGMSEAPALQVVPAAARSDRTQHFILLGKDPFYALASDGLDADRLWLAAVRLARSGTDLGPFLVEDRHVTGESVYSLASEPLDLNDLTPGLATAGFGRERRASFRADLLRGSTIKPTAMLRRDVAVEILSVLSVPPLLSSATKPADCSLFLFGSHGELFALGSLGPRAASAQSRPQLARVRVRSGIFSTAQASSISRGVCFEPGRPHGNPEQVVDVLDVLPFFTH